MGASLLALPLFLTIGAQSYNVQGYGIFQYQGAPNIRLKVEIPAAEGQFRVTDCDADLTPYQRPLDFNYSETKGFLFWSRKVRLLTETPAFDIPTKNRNLCTVSVELAALGLAKGEAYLVFHSYEKDEDKLAARLKLTCEGQALDIDGVGSCKALSGSKVTIGFQPLFPKGKVILSAIDDRSECRDYQEKSFDVGSNPSSIVKLQDLPMPKGPCVGLVSIVYDTGTTTKTMRAKVLLVGQDRSANLLAQPSFLWVDADKKKFKIWTPLKTVSMKVTYINKDNKPQSKVVTDENTDIKLDDLQPGSIVCASAYSAESGSSHACVKSSDLTQIDFIVR